MACIYHIRARGEADVMIKTGSDDCIVWWPVSTGVAMQGDCRLFDGFFGSLAGGQGNQARWNGRSTRRR